MLASEIANRCIYNQVEKDCKINLSNRQIICIWQFLPVVANSAPATVARCLEAIPDVAAGPFGRSRGPGLVLVARATVAMWANRNRGVGNLVDCGNADGVVFCSASHPERALNNAPKPVGPKLAEIRKYGLFINMVG